MERRIWAEDLEACKEQAQDKARKNERKTKDKAYDVKEKTRGYAEETKDKVNEGASRAADKAYETKEKAKDKAYDVKEKTKDKAEETKDRAKDMQRIQREIRGLAQGTAQKVTEAVVGSGEEADRERHDVDKGVEDLSKKAKENWKDDDDDLK
ncbi:hypothetical protein HID58_096073, partial [Brassica napus]